MSIFFAVLSALLYGSADFLGGFGSRKNTLFSVLIVSQLAGLVIAALGVPLVGSSAPLPSDLLWGALGGLGGSLGLAFLYYGIAKTFVAVVSPVSALVGAVVPMLFGLIIGEHPSLLAWIGAGLCLPATVLLSFDGQRLAGSDKTRRAILFGVLAGLGFGFFFIAVSRPREAAGLWPLLSARVTSVSAIAITAILLRKPVRILANQLAVVLATGVFDMGANIAFVLASRGDNLILATVITALYPGPTVLLARIFLKERMGPARFVGILLALLGVALIALG